MRITELIIDGFKSYAVRTVISGWDHTFNAITGLNGSGKSNILDAICFCLGIGKFELLRASGGASDLIYKRGQAGITKASVTLVFDNSDKAKSPIGFEDYGSISVTRQIVLGGTSKYLINGHRAQQQTVQNLFQSVQLNINNPNFLIMQGKITKVLNMKSTEILGMVEEAAGTRMFEDRREKALKTMNKKQAKVEELEGLLKEEIEPKLDKLRNEKRAFLEFQSTQSDLERLTKLVVAYDYTRSKQKVQQSAQDLVEKKQRVTHLEENAEKLRREIGVLEEDMEKVRAARDKELRKGGKFAKLEEAVKEYSKELERLKTVVELKQGSIAEEQERLQKAQASVKDLEKQIKQKTEAHQQLREQFETSNKQIEEQKDEVDQKEELLQTLQTGISSNAGSDGGYAGQLTAARDNSSKAGTEIEQAKLKITHLEARIKEDEPRAKKAEKENAGLLKDLESLRTQAAKHQKELEKLGFEPGREEEQQAQKTQLEKRIRHLQGEADNFRRQVQGLDFSYSDPEPNFDRRRVKGLVAQLFNLPADSTEASVALEICAGGRLYNVVVDSAKTSSALIDNGKLRRRVTIVPLDKVDAHRAPSDRVNNAQKLAPGKVHLAINLIGYAHEVEKAMEYVFGNTLVCADPATAKKVTFDPSVRLKSVTVEGDVYDPSGTLSGGSAASGSGVLLKLQKLNAITSELEQEESKLTALENAISKDAQKLKSGRQLKQDLDLKTHEIQLAESQIASNSSSSIIASVQEMKETIAALKENIQTAKKRQSEAEQDAKRIEKDMKDFSSNKGAKLEQLQGDLDKLKKALAKAQGSIKPLQQEVRDANIDAEQTGSDLSAAQEEQHDAETTLKGHEEELQAIQKEGRQVTRQHEEAEAALNDERKKLSSFDDEIADLEHASKRKAQQISDEKLESQKLGHAIDNFVKAQQGAQQAVTMLEKEHDWIHEEQNSFGKAGTPYDFHGQDIAQSKSNLKNVTERFQGMKKKINPAVMATIDSVEKKETALKQMMRTVIKDKKKIEETIATLDEYKKEALYKTWSKVNEDFGLIFNDLLPGNTAKLDPPEGKEISDGLEVKVCLGKVWKQSLTELSGGQRSLIALSLILSLLQYSPAPMYILDEVDAALDLSHTQNIGRLIRTRFRGSQFIVVSLKDGMFGNANRIFRTRFMDGTSVVQALTPADMK
ncbi:Structural maintenance of chromosomes protein 2 [Fulvia fulva]|uniref:Structural maintenance of chromosomes protein n=1 Tax=Passalora fulva TaxID=5499 RepID=A0A9Q8LDG7_PASFU|nr:Structural maintenance of chromosomes protein 2 [Fulvia fulva]KAK4629022.1 Structural maintenance of chromosomes protein 2 [Fulvia fulva]KAK4630398.1 Structural maintenance of chromosomes protein 2 [Fulvia fulva]UJO15364.1 Structural maintenance of chromosomes protein 2 [Fulvia fulva]WPV12797.1 Structural maintenance of chromosomes protein 2 [Fulvia fulva]WPV27256.1 Structural maintenance of chromosomes protein 2 [Fulvia fulva]